MDAVCSQKHLFGGFKFTIHRHLKSSKCMDMIISVVHALLHHVCICLDTFLCFYLFCNFYQLRVGINNLSSVSFLKPKINRADRPGSIRRFHLMPAAAASAFLVWVVKFEVSAVMTAPARSRLPGWGGVRCDWSGKEHNREQSGPMAERWAEGNRLITKWGSVRRAEAGERPANRQTWNTELLSVGSTGDRQTRH